MKFFTDAYVDVYVCQPTGANVPMPLFEYPILEERSGVATPIDR